MPQKDCDRKTPLQRGGEAVVNVVQKGNRNEKWVLSESAHEGCCYSNSAVRNLNGQASSTLFCATDGWPFLKGWWISIVPHSTQPSRVSTRPVLAVGCLDLAIVQREAEWGGWIMSSTRRKEELGQTWLQIICWKTELQQDRTRSKAHIA